MSVVVKQNVFSFVHTHFIQTLPKKTHALNLGVVVCLIRFICGSFTFIDSIIHMQFIVIHWMVTRLINRLIDRLPVYSLSFVFLLALTHVNYRSSACFDSCLHGEFLRLHSSWFNWLIHWVLWLICLHGCLARLTEWLHACFSSASRTLGS